MEKEGTTIVTELIAYLKKIMERYNLVISNEPDKGAGMFGHELFSAEDFRLFALHYVQLWRDRGETVEEIEGSGLFRIILPPKTVPRGRFNRFEIDWSSSGSNVITETPNGLYSVSEEYNAAQSNYARANNTRLFDANGNAIYYEDCSVEDMVFLIRDLLRSLTYMLFYSRV